MAWDSVTTTRPTTERFRVQSKSSRSGKRLDYAVIDTSTTNPQPSLRIWCEDDDDAARRWAGQVAALLNHVAEHSPRALTYGEFRESCQNLSLTSESQIDQSLNS